MLEVIEDRLQQVVLDPLQSSDLIQAQAAAQLATLVVKRLENVLPRLQLKHQTVAAQERRARWRQAADVVEGERDAMAAEFAEKYPALVSQLVDLFERSGLPTPTRSHQGCRSELRGASCKPHRTSATPQHHQAAGPRR